MKNKTFGSAFIIAGTTIGADASNATYIKEMGFTYTLILLFHFGFYSYSALLFVEVYQKAEREEAGIATLAETRYFGMGGRIITLHYLS